jgi:catechol 2,3-dioxygenase-like lactoylglutathione lyase family enzyme
MRRTLVFPLICAALLWTGRGATPGLAAESQPQLRPRITGIDHVAFRISQVAAARLFYGTLLGLHERPGRGSSLSYAIGRQYVLLLPGLPAGEDERLSHIALHVPDITALRRHLDAAGIKVEQPEDRCEASAIRVVDPDGHTIEFVETSWPPNNPVPTTDRAIATRLLHAGIVVRDEEAAHRLYRDVLGMSEIWRGGRTNERTDWINMRVPQGTDYLEYMLVAAPPDRRQRGVLHHMCLVVPDIQLAWETIAARTPTELRMQLSPPNVGRNNRWQLNLYDPDGTRTELMEPYTVR